MWSDYRPCAGPESPTTINEAGYEGDPAHGVVRIVRCTRFPLPGAAAVLQVAYPSSSCSTEDRKNRPTTRGTPSR